MSEAATNRRVTTPHLQRASGPTNRNPCRRVATIMIADGPATGQPVPTRRAIWAPGAVGRAVHCGDRWRASE